MIEFARNMGKKRYALALAVSMLKEGQTLVIAEPNKTPEQWTRITRNATDKPLIGEKP